MQHIKLLVENFIEFCDHYKKSIFIKFIIFKMVRKRKTEREKERERSTKKRQRQKERETKRDREVYFLR